MRYPIPLICAVVFCGCTESGPSAGPAIVESGSSLQPVGTAIDGDGATPANAVPAQDASSGRVELTIADWKTIQEFVAARKGKVVVLDLWSTSCLPCMREFPHLVELHKERGEQVECISVSCDYVGIKDKPVETYSDRVMAFLKKQNAGFKNFLSSDESDKLFEAIDLASIPAIYIYDQGGNLAKRFDNDDEAAFGDDGFTYKDHVIPLIDQLLSAN